MDWDRFWWDSLCVNNRIEGDRIGSCRIVQDWKGTNEMEFFKWKNWVVIVSWWRGWGQRPLNNHQMKQTKLMKQMKHVKQTTNAVDAVGRSSFASNGVTRHHRTKFYFQSNPIQSKPIQSSFHNWLISTIFNKQTAITLDSNCTR